MEDREQSISKIDLCFFLGLWLRHARRFWALALVMAAMGACILGFAGSWFYTPVYEATVSFTVKASNPLYGSDHTHNNAAAKQLHSTFPYILRSEILRQRVSAYLGVEEIPEVSTSVMENSNIFTIRVRHTDPQWANEVIRAMVVCYPQIADYVVGATDLIVLDESGIPQKPMYERELSDDLLLGAAGGVVIWCVCILVMTLSRRTVHNEEELLQTLNCNCLGIVPATKVVGKDRRCPLLHRDSGKFGFAESVRFLQMHVSREMRARNKKVLMVSGAIPEEGKTTIAINLAIASAKAGMRTLLVDCDRYNPSVNRNLNLQEAASMGECGKGSIRDQQMQIETGIRHLYCMTLDMDIKEKCGKEALEKHLGTARETFDLILLDTPPCSVMVDAAELSDLADCALMVVRQDYASRSQIVEGVRLLTDSGLPMIGCVLNGVRGSLAADGSRYGYGYGYAGRSPDSR